MTLRIIQLERLSKTQSNKLLTVEVARSLAHEVSRFLGYQEPEPLIVEVPMGKLSGLQLGRIILMTQARQRWTTFNLLLIPTAFPRSLSHLIAKQQAVALGT